MLKHGFPEALIVNKFPKTTVYKKQYCSKWYNSKQWEFLLTPDNAHTFFEYYFHEEPILDVSTVEYLIKEMNFHKVQKKG